MEANLTQLRTLIVGVVGILAPVIANGAKAMGIRSVEVAEDGERALRLIRAAKPKPDLVICDWDAPKLNGVDLVKALRAAGERVVFIMLTAPNDPAAAVLAKRHGASDCLAKPFTPEQLEAKVRAAMQANNARRPAA